MAIFIASGLIFASFSISTFDISALEWILLPINRSCCIFLASITFSLSSILVSPDRFSPSSPVLTRGTWMNISTLSRIGHESRDRYLSIDTGEQTQGFSGSHIYQHGQGFMAPTRENLAGYRHD